MSRIIKNGKAYPKSLKKAVIAAMKGTQSNSQIAEDFNISKGTVQTWKRQASVQRAVPVGLARYQAASAALKAYNTPTITTDSNGVTTIAYKGHIYR